MIWYVQHTHHQLMMFSDHIVSVSSHHTQRVSAHQAHICACSAHLTAVLELGTYGVDCEQQSQGLCVLV